MLSNPKIGKRPIILLLAGHFRVEKGTGAALAVSVFEMGNA